MRNYTKQQQNAPAERERSGQRDRSARRGAGPADITVAVCTYRRYALLDLALQSLVRQAVPHEPARILVVDNSPDAPGSHAAEARWRTCANLTWLREPQPGLSRARNAAIAATQTPFIAFLDDDAVADPGWLAALLAAFERLGPAAHVVGGRVSLQFEAPRPDWLGDALLMYLSGCDLGRETRFLTPGELVVGANIAYRTEAVRTAGGFSTSLGRIGGGATLLSNDETELEERIHARGGRTGYAPAAHVTHRVTPDRLTQAWLRRRSAWQAVSDFVRAPQQTQDGSDEAWRRVRRYLATCRPADRTLRGLTLQEPDPERFTRQVFAVYDAVTTLLAATGDPDPDAA